MRRLITSLEREPWSTQRQLSEAGGFALTMVSTVLQALEAVGRVESQVRDGGRGQGVRVYRLRGVNG